MDKHMLERGRGKGCGYIHVVFRDDGEAGDLVAKLTGQHFEQHAVVRRWSEEAARGGGTMSGARHKAQGVGQRRGP
jgi:hypothetical protein